MKRNDIRFFLYLMMTGLIFLMMSGCQQKVETEVSRIINGCFSDDGKTIILVESVYLTSEPENPYYNDPEAHHYRSVLYETGTNLSRTNLIGMWTDLMIDQQWTNEIIPGGRMEYELIYWLSGPDILCGMNFLDSGAYFFKPDQSMPVRLELDSEKIKSLLPENLKYLSNQFEAMDMAPSPDSSMFGVCFESAYIPEDGSFYDLCFEYLFAVYDLNGDLKSTVFLSRTNSQENLRFYPYGIEDCQSYFLWSADSDQVYLFSENEAFTVSGFNDFVLQCRYTEKIPEMRKVTRNGRLSDQGIRIDIRKNGNHAEAVLTNTGKSIRMEEIRLINFQ